MKVVDLFSGCGGLALGFSNAGFEVVASIDNWQTALKTYEANLSHHTVLFDLSDVEGAVELITELNPDMIAGGPPCQDFSHAGKRDENQGRGDLTISFAQIIDSVRPKYFLMENVDRLTGTDKFKRAYRLWKKAGYGITIKLLDASFCGVPQKRKRYFVFGELGGVDGALESHLENRLAPKPMTVRQFFKRDLDVEYYYRHPRNYARRAVYSIDEPSPTIRGVSRPIPSGYPGHPADATTDFSKVRPLTSTERARIQTFPKNFKFIGSKVDVEQMIGNAVPVKLAEYVAKAILSYVNRSKDEEVFRKTLFEV